MKRQESENIFQLWLGHLSMTLADSKESHQQCDELFFDRHLRSFVPLTSRLCGLQHRGAMWEWINGPQKSWQLLTFGSAKRCWVGEGEGKRTKPLDKENLSPWHELLMRSLRLQGNRKGTGTNSAKESVRWCTALARSMRPTRLTPSGLTTVFSCGIWELFGYG